jgi:hypothetical protein
VSAYRQDREPCVECARREAEAKAAPLPVWKRKLFSIGASYVTLVLLLLGTYFVAGWTEDGRNALCVTALIAGGIATIVSLVIAVDAQS